LAEATFNIVSHPRHPTFLLTAFAIGVLVKKAIEINHVPKLLFIPNTNCIIEVSDIARLPSMSMSRRATFAAQARRDCYHPLVCWEGQFTRGKAMEKPIELNDDEIAAVGGGSATNIIIHMNSPHPGHRANFNDSLNNNFASFAVNSNNNSFNNSFNTILSFNII